MFFHLCHVVTEWRHSRFAYYVIKYKPIDIRGKSIINDTASNHRVILQTYSKERGSDRCERRKVEPKNQDMNFEIIILSNLYWPAVPSPQTVIGPTEPLMVALAFSANTDFHYII